MHGSSYFAPLKAFGGRFDVTGLIPADQYGQCSSPYYIIGHSPSIPKDIESICIDLMGPKLGNFVLWLF
jgi:hypothetical protein